MKSIVLILLAALLVVVAKEAMKPLQYNLDEAPALFQTFIIQYKKRYKSGKDVQAHFDAFKDNLVQMNRQNMEHFPNEVYTINQFSDLNGAEKSRFPNIFSKKSR